MKDKEIDKKIKELQDEKSRIYEQNYDINVKLQATKIKKIKTKKERIRKINNFFNPEFSMYSMLSSSVYEPLRSKKYRKLTGKLLEELIDKFIEEIK